MVQHTCDLLTCLFISYRYVGKFSISRFFCVFLIFDKPGQKVCRMSNPSIFKKFLGCEVILKDIECIFLLGDLKIVAKLVLS